MERVVIRRYSEAFKVQVVSELESGQLRSIGEARRLYGIVGGETVVSWLKKYGKERHLPRIMRVETLDERDQLKQLRQENDRLKKALADEHMKASLYESWLEIACEEFGVEDVDGFKKKLASQQSPGV